MNQSAKLDDMVQIVKTNAIAAKMVALASPNQVIMKNYIFSGVTRKKELKGGGGRKHCSSSGILFEKRL